MGLVILQICAGNKSYGNASVAQRHQVPISVWSQLSSDSFPELNKGNSLANKTLCRLSATSISSLLRFLDSLTCFFPLGSDIINHLSEQDFWLPPPLSRFFFLSRQPYPSGLQSSVSNSTEAHLFFFSSFCDERCLLCSWAPNGARITARTNTHLSMCCEL